VEFDAIPVLSFKYQHSVPRKIFSQVYHEAGNSCGISTVIQRLHTMQRTWACGTLLLMHLNTIKIINIYSLTLDAHKGIHASLQMLRQNGNAVRMVRHLMQVMSSSTSKQSLKTRPYVVPVEYREGLQFQSWENVF